MDREVGIRIVKDWMSNFPQLSIYSQDKLYKILGCFVIGIELIKLPRSEEYSPHFVMYPLWKMGVGKCLEAPVLMKQLYNKKSLQFKIAYDKHANLFDDAVKNFKEQDFISMNGDVALGTILALIDSMFNSVLVKSNSAEQAKLLEMEFYSALYVEDRNQADDILNSIHNAKQNWNMQLFEIWYGKFDLWIHKLEGHLQDFKPILKIIEDNKTASKIMPLMSSNIVNNPKIP
jgi:hypothetical protein